MKKERGRKEEIKSPSYKKEWFAVSTLFLVMIFLLCDYQNIRIQTNIASPNIIHHTVLSSNTKPTSPIIRGNHISINNIAHTIVQNILLFHNK